MQNLRLLSETASIDPQSFMHESIIYKHIKIPTIAQQVLFLSCNVGPVLHLRVCIGLYLIKIKTIKAQPDRWR